MNTSVTQLLEELAAQGVRLSVDEGHLILHGAKDLLADGLRARLAAHKSEIIALFREHDARRTAPLQEIEPRPEEWYQPFPLTDLQQAYWVGQSDALELGNVCCHYYVEFDGRELDLARLEAAWNHLVRRHDMLRAVILSDGRQQILEEAPAVYRIKMLDLRGRDERATGERLEEVRRELSHQVFEPSAWPQFEIRATRTDEQTRFHLSINILVVDVYGIFQVFKEWQQLYENPEAQLEPLRLSFRDYVLAEASFRESELFKRSEEYWRGRISTLPPRPDLPLAVIPRAVERPWFVRRTGRIEPEAWQRLKQRSQQAGVSHTALLSAAFAEVLAAWSTSPRFTLNLPLLFRLPFHPQVNSILGPSTSTLLLEVDATPDCSFEARAQRLQRRMTLDLSHYHMGGVRVLRELSRLRGSTGLASMPVVFTSTLGHRDLFGDDPFKDWLGKEVYSISQTPQVWLDHQAVERKGCLHFNWDAVEELFPPGLLEEMFGAYTELLQRLSRDESAWNERARSLVPAAQMEERRRANATESPVSERLLHSFFEEQAAMLPDQPALISNERTLTYEELRRRSEQVASRLREMGARPNTLVAVLMSKGWEQVVAVLGILKSGAAYLPVDASLPRQRIHYLLDNGRAELVLTQTRWDETLEWPEGVRRLRVDALDGAEVTEEPRVPAQGPDDLAYVIYTSGSTGQPKGVMIDHRSAVNTVLDINERFGVRPDDRVLALSSLNFDLSVYDIFGTLAAGATIILPPADSSRNPAAWAELMRAHRVSVWNSVPTLMKMLVEYAEGRDDIGLDALRVVLLSGDWIPVRLPEQARALAPGAQVISLGGATEAAIWSIYYPIEEVDPNWKSIPYGRPLLNQRFHVLDAALEDCPTWVPGHLYIGGVGLARGYWRDEEKTSKSFIKHPVTGKRLYRTGDLGRYLPGGDIEFLGRDDFQVKVSGHRIELGEIEAALAEHPRVAGAVVTAVGTGADRRLAGYVVAREAQAAGAGTEVAASEPLLGNVEASQLEGVLLDTFERMDFTLKGHGIRHTNGSHGASIRLGGADEEGLHRLQRERRTHRRFRRGPLAFEEFSRFLSSLREVEVGGLRRHAYASAGSLYPVQVYLHVKEGAVEGVGPGTYYYHPAEHQLVPLTPGATVERSVHAIPNRKVFDESGFSVMLVAQMKAIAPMYGPLARDFCTLEAGYMSQLLMMAAHTAGVGLCPVGTLDFEKIRDLFLLEESHVLLHSLLGGGAVAESGDDRAASNGHGEVARDGRAQEPGEGLAAELRGFLKERLPDYMVPTTLVLLDSLPLTAEGKVNRQALPDPGEVSAQRAEAYAPPRTDLERTLATIVEEVLGLERVGIHDNFFEAGGNSLQLIQIQRRLSAALGRELAIVDFFRYPTISAFVASLEQQSRRPVIAAAAARSEIRSLSRDRRERLGHRAQSAAGQDEHSDE